MKKLDRKFFERDTLVVAKELLGKYIVRNLKTKVLIGRIVETEAYISEDDLACHASKGRTARTEIMYGEAGHAYIYMIYGMYHCLNIVTEKEGFPAAVLIRAVEPIAGVINNNSQDLSKLVKSSQSMTKFGASESEYLTKHDLKKFASGPGKLCRWMEIDRGLNGANIVDNEELYITDELPKDVILATSVKHERPESVIEPLDSCLRRNDRGGEFEIVETKRIGVDYAKHCADHRWRFYIKDNEFVSRKVKI